MKQILTRKLEEEDIKITKRSFWRGQEFETPPVVQKEISSTTFDLSVDRLERILKRHRDFKINYIPLAFEKIKVVDEEEMEVAVMHNPCHSTIYKTVYVVKSSPNIEIIPSGEPVKKRKYKGCKRWFLGIIGKKE